MTIFHSLYNLIFKCIPSSIIYFERVFDFDSLFRKIVLLVELQTNSSQNRADDYILNKKKIKFMQSKTRLLYLA